MAKLSIDMLMRLDREKLAEVPKKEIKADRLSQLMGEEVMVEIKALSGDTYTDLIATAANKKGNVDVRKTFRARALIVVESMVTPSLKDKELRNILVRRHRSSLGKDFVPRRGTCKSL